MKKAKWLLVLTLVMGLLSSPMISHSIAVSSGGGTGTGGTGDTPPEKK
jgi:hypothetical protein